MLGHEINGDADDNNLVGGDGPDVINGLGGNDTLTGGLGDDTLNGGEGVDTAAFNDIDVPVSVTLNGDGDGTAVRETGFAIEVDDVDVTPLTPAAPAGVDFLTEALDGNLYFNIHTQDFGGGEIRGQIDEPISDTTVEGVRTVVIGASLDAAQEPGPTSDSEATGTAVVTIVQAVDGSLTYSVELEVSGLATSNLLPVAIFSAIHIHNAPRGENGPVILDVVQDAGGDVFGVALSESADTGDGNVFHEVVETDTLTSIESIIGSDDGDEIILSGPLGNQVDGLGGDDFIAGGGGTDVLDGGEGFDTNSFSTIGVGVTADLNDETAVYVLPNGVVINETFENFEALDGSAQDDVLSGDAGANVLTGNDGDDVLSGRGGADTLNGGDGDDVLQGGGGADVLDGGEGSDTADFSDINAAAENPAEAGVTANLVDGEASYTAPSGALITDTFANIENLVGSNNDDQLTGDDGDNLIDGGAGADILIGAGGDDTLVSDDLDALDGGEGVDTADFSGFAANTVQNTPGVFDGVIVDLDVNSAGAAGTPGQRGAVLNSPPGAVAVGGVVPAANQIQPVDDVENIIGSDFNDGLFGNNEVNVISAGSGNDVVHGFGGDDFLAGGEGIDTILFSASPTGVNVDLTSQLSEAEFDAAVAQGAGPTAASGGTGLDVLSGFENVTGSAAGDDVIVGDDAANTLNGLGGDDVLVGGGADDALLGGAGDDILDGGVGADTLNGGDGDDRLVGRAGADRLIDGAGEDVLIGGNGADFLRSGAGDDIVSGGRGTDVVFAGGGADVVRGGAGRDVLNGNGGDDFIVGGGGADRIIGGRGDDVQVGGGGADVFVFNGASGSDVIRDFGGRDTIEITAGASEFADLTITDTDAGALIEFGRTDALLVGVDAGSLNESDFVFS